MAAPVNPPPTASALREWWRQPRLTWWVLALGAALLALRKPWALTTPQLWAEDGSIFLVQDNVVGLRAFLAPYNGYLHALPRVIAWIARHTADVAWWPAIYNGAAFVATIGLLARMVSPRLDLPGKAWLALALILVAQSGEVLLNVTNLQWITAFFLLQQTLIARPVTAAQRAGDLALTTITGLTGPFAILLLPFFAWRWWRDRHADNLVLLALVAACAGVQAWFITTTGAPPDWSQPFHLDVLLATLGNRLVVWPLLGPRAVAALSARAMAVIGCAVVIPLVLWTLRPHPRRALRGHILAAFVLFAVAGIYRSRPDTWLSSDVENADRYCYLPRVLLVWLLIWEFDARPRAVALAARVFCLVGLLANLPTFILRTPPDYHWAERCDPIRRGVPAAIPTLPEGWMLEYPGRPRSR